MYQMTTRQRPLDAPNTQAFFRHSSSSIHFERERLTLEVCPFNQLLQLNVTEWIGMDPFFWRNFLRLEQFFWRSITVSFIAAAGWSGRIKFEFSSSVNVKHIERDQGLNRQRIAVTAASLIGWKKNFFLKKKVQWESNLKLWSSEH